MQGVEIEASLNMERVVKKYGTYEEAKNIGVGIKLTVDAVVLFSDSHLRSETQKENQPRFSLQSANERRISKYNT